MELEVTGPGIRKQIEQSKEFEVHSGGLTMELLEETIKDLYRKPSSREIVVRTGYFGMLLFDLAMRGLKAPSDDIKWTHSTHKNHLVIHMHRKHGMLKAYLTYSSPVSEFVVKYGTLVLFKTTDLSEEYTCKILSRYAT